MGFISSSLSKAIPSAGWWWPPARPSKKLRRASSNVTASTLRFASQPRRASDIGVKALPISREQFGVSFGFYQFARLFEVVVNNGLRVDPEGVIDGGQEFHRVDRLFGGAATGLVGLAMDIAAFDAGAGN